MKTFEEIAELERRYLLGTYNRYPIVLTRGKGVFLYGLGGDFSRPYGTGFGFTASHPALKRRAIVRRLHGRKHRPASTPQTGCSGSA